MISQLLIVNFPYLAIYSLNNPVLRNCTLPSTSQNCPVYPVLQIHLYPPPLDGAHCPSAHLEYNKHFRDRANLKGWDSNADLKLCKYKNLRIILRFNADLKLCKYKNLRIILGFNDDLKLCKYKNLRIILGFNDDLKLCKYKNLWIILGFLNKNTVVYWNVNRFGKERKKLFYICRGNRNL